ncbi:hypothetical protein GOBAR_DD18056 [Gossypium barbadense]|nr:hypothetical protein GOBAR_DD18056 [Gossypium barbadense]
MELASKRVLRGAVMEANGVNWGILVLGFEGLMEREKGEALCPTLTVPGAILAVGALSYLWATPGVTPGFFDMFVLAFLERLFRPTFKKDDFVLGKKLGEGAFGVVYKVSFANKKPNSKVRLRV